jgi:hypothetical protein
MRFFIWKASLPPMCHTKRKSNKKVMGVMGIMLNYHWNPLDDITDRLNGLPRVNSSGP